jgi:hypothetical protein
MLIAQPQARHDKLSSFNAEAETVVAKEIDNPRPGPPSLRLRCRNETFAPEMWLIPDNLDGILCHNDSQANPCPAACPKATKARHRGRM